MQPPASSAYQLEPVSYYPPPHSELYLCGRTRGMEQDSARDKQQASLEALNRCYQALNSHKIKDTLGSFLPNIPGEFEASESQDTMLRALIEHRPIGGKEFFPLSGQALLGFRLVPGSLPEQCRMDPSLQQQRHHKRKKKHRHRDIDKTEVEGAADIVPAPISRSPAQQDPFSFIKETTYPSKPSMAATHIMQGSPSFVPVPVKQPSPISYVQYPPGGATQQATGPLQVGAGLPPDTVRIKKKKKNGPDGGPKKKKKKDKEKRRRKHHGLETSLAQPSQPLLAPPPSHPHQQFQ